METGYQLGSDSAELDRLDLQPQGMIGVQPHFAPDDPDGAAILAGIVTTALPLIGQAGAATAAQVGADTLRQRIATNLAAPAPSSPTRY